MVSAAGTDIAGATDIAADTRAAIVVELQDATGKPSFSSVSGDGHDALDDLFDLLGPGGQPGLDLNPV